MAGRTKRIMILGWLVATTLSLGSCRFGSDLALQIGALTIGPNPAAAGESVTFRFGLTVVPEKNVTITAFINDEAYFSQTKLVFWDALYEFEIGGADPMIARFGVGVHTARVQVFVIDEGRTLRTQAVPFELE